MSRELIVLPVQKLFSSPHLKVLIVHKELKIYVPRYDSILLYLFLFSGNFSKLHKVNEGYNKCNVCMYVYVHIIHILHMYLLCNLVS